jgi:hypothetical protein
VVLVTRLRPPTTKAPRGRTGSTDEPTLSRLRRITQHILKPSRSPVRANHVKFGTTCLLLLCLLGPASAQVQDSPRELVAKMVQNELTSQKQPRYWMYLDSTEKPGQTEVDRVIQTPECWVSWPVSVNGSPPTEKEMSKARDHMESLVNNPRLRRKNRAEIDADSHKSAELLKMLPDVFLFTGDGRQGNSVRLKFRPNPKYRPPSNESKVFHHMEGIVLIDAKQIRLARLSGTLTSDVEFGFGILGKLQKGGTFEVIQSEVAPNYWEVSLLDVQISGRALFFHTIGEQQHEIKSQFESVRSDLGVAEAAARVVRNSNQTLASSPGSR